MGTTAKFRISPQKMNDRLGKSVNFLFRGGKNKTKNEWLFWRTHSTCLKPNESRTHNLF